MQDNTLYNWLFHYNAHEKKWSGFTRDDYRAYWNGEESKYAIIKSSKLETVIEIIRMTQGDKKLVEAL